MKLTLNIILESMGIQSNHHIEARSFSNAVCLNKIDTELSNDSICIAPFEIAMIICAQNPEQYCLCPEEENLPEKLPKNVIPVYGEYDLLALARRVHDLFNSMQEWVSAMHLAIIKGKEIQELINLSEPVLKNSIHVMDTNFNLVSYSNRVEPFDEFSISLRKNGYLSDEALELLGGKDAVKRLESYDEQGVVFFPQACPFKLVYKIHRFQNTFYMLTDMICDHVQLSPGLEDKFDIWIENLSICIEAKWKREQEKVRSNEAIFKSLIDGEKDDLTGSGNVVDNLKLPGRGHYLLLSFQTDFLTGILLSRRIYTISIMLRNALVSTYGGRIVALLHSTCMDSLISDDTIEHLTKQLEFWGIFCGMSELYTELSDTSVAFRQADLALQFGSIPQQAILGPETPCTPKGNRIIRFSDVSIYAMFWEHRRHYESIIVNTRYGKMIRTLMASDRKRKMSDSSVLYTYLLHERNATETGEILHMHRNNVIYHIGKIQDMMNVDLNDPTVRFYLLSIMTVLAISSYDDE